MRFAVRLLSELLLKEVFEASEWHNFRLNPTFGGLIANINWASTLNLRSLGRSLISSKQLKAARYALLLGFQ